MAATSENIVYLAPRDRQPEPSSVDSRILDIQRQITALMVDEGTSVEAFTALSQIVSALGDVKLDK